MRRSKLTALVVIVASVTVGWAGVAAAQRPVALITDIVGAETDDVGAFDEVTAGTSIILGSGGRLEFQHYQRCESVVVEGGRVNFSRQTYQTQQGKIIDVQRSKCPKTVAVGVEVSGVRLRAAGISGGLRLTSEPTFVLVGDKRAAYVRLRIREGDTTVFESPLDGWRFTWPDGKPPLKVGASYTLDLLTRDDAEIRSVNVTIAEQRGGPPLNLIRID